MTPELITILVGMAPVAEIRGAIPVGLTLGFSPFLSYLYGVIGNLLPIVPLFFGIQWAAGAVAKRSETVDRILKKLFRYTQIRHGEKFSYGERYEHLRPWLEALSLFVFVAIPLPLTGVWSGTLAAFVFGIPFRRAFPAMTLGVLMSGLLVLSISLGVIHIF